MKGRGRPFPLDKRFIEGIGHGIECPPWMPLGRPDLEIHLVFQTGRIFSLWGIQNIRNEFFGHIETNHLMPKLIQILRCFKQRRRFGFKSL